MVVGVTNRDKALRLLASCNDMWLERHPDYKNGYSGDKSLQAFHLGGAYGMQEITFVQPGTTGHVEMSGYCSWSELASYVKGLYQGMAYATGRLGY